MGRKKDSSLWEHVEKVDGGLKCKFCGNVFAGKPSISRIRFHLSKTKGHGIKICEEVPEDVRQEACGATVVSNKKPRIMPSSTNNEGSDRIPTSSGEQNNEVENQVRDVERRQPEVQSIEQELQENTFSLIEEGNGIENMINEVMQPVDHRGGFIDGLVFDACETRGDTLLTTKLFGQAFQNIMENIWSWLIKDDVFSIAVSGMAGVGKTELVKHINNKLVENNLDSCDRVCWVSVSPNFSIHKLQYAIAKTVNLDLSNEDDENLKAAKLSAALRRKKYVIILDDVWSYIPLKRVGIPVGMNRCKVVLTTRSSDVCRMIGCQRHIGMEPLLWEEAWNLFKETLGHETVLSSEVEGIAESIVEECAGLPLGIISMAISMKGVADIREWRNALEKLERSIPRQENEEMFNSLKLSYDYLNDATLQQCFLYCALFPERFEIGRDELIEYLIADGIIKGKKSRKAEFDEGHTMLNKLENACLLESSTCNGDVGMHDLIRDMALQIMKMSLGAMVEAHTGLEELPDEEGWTNDLVKVSLMNNYIVKISPCVPPRCPNLSTLLLCENHCLEWIADSFFEQLDGLKVLDLSDTNIRKLPNSISNLVNLTALLLRLCKNLRHIPSLAKLRALKKLDLFGTGIEEVPEGMELLCNLRYLNICATYIDKLPLGMLPMLPQLQFLHIPSNQNLKTVKGEEVACLTKLETLSCHFHDLREFNAYTQALEKRGDNNRPQLSNFIISIGNGYPDHLRCDLESSKSVILDGCDIISRDKDIVGLPEDIQRLIIKSCTVAVGLCDVCPLESVAELEELEIEYCDGIECLFSLEKLRVSFGRGGAASPPPPLASKAPFSHLTDLIICNCPSMKKLFPPGLLSNFQNLKYMKIKNCEKLEEIVTREEDEEEEGEGVMGEQRGCIHFTLPKLKILHLVDLPELKNIYTGKLICDSLQGIAIINCLKLKRMPISLPLLDNGQPSSPPSLQVINIYPKEWWESVEWDHPHAKDALLPIVYFRPFVVWSL